MDKENGLCQVSSMISYFLQEKSGQGQEPILMKKKKKFENYCSLRWSSTLHGVNLPRYFKAFEFVLR